MDIQTKIADKQTGKAPAKTADKAVQKAVHKKTAHKKTAQPIPMPRHIAIIMDGNGRWAEKRGLARTQGHKHGVETVRKIVEVAGQRGIPYLTLYAFSSENHKRPEEEVNFLMGLICDYVERDLARLHAENVCIKVIGCRDGIEARIRDLIEHAEQLTAKNQAMTLQVAFNYGSWQEIATTARKLAEQVAAGQLQAADIDSNLFDRALTINGLPHPDLIIRTGGEYRLSNFLLWQSAYAELIFQPILWPDYTEADLEQAIIEYGRRERRYGGLNNATVQTMEY